jgi:hypothetical protein
LKSHPVWNLSDEDATAHAWLERRVTAAWQAVPLETVLRELSEQEQIDIRCDERSLPEIDWQTPITLSVTETALGDVLERMLDPRGFMIDVKAGQLLVRAWPVTPLARDVKLQRILREPTHFDFESGSLESALRSLAVQHKFKLVLDIPEGPDAVSIRKGDIVLRSEDWTLRAGLRHLLDPSRLTVQIHDGALHVVPLPKTEPE